jgi:hypothetical protein
MNIAAFKVIAVMMEAVRTSETSVHFNQTTRRYTPRCCHLRTRCSCYLKCLFNPF